MINLIKKHQISIAIVLLAITQVPDFIAKSNFNHCVKIRGYIINGRSYDGDYGRMPAVIECNGGLTDG